MNITSGFSRGSVILSLLITVFLPDCAPGAVSSATNSQFASTPINLTSSDVTPLVMLNVSRDHQLSYKAYTDYADLDGNGVPETTYTDTIDYYGYFDSKKCYTYKNSRFEPVSIITTTDHYCNGTWSGNFLNWSTMTRMDVLRKILYGGKRYTDTTSETVLERQYLPTDAHSFAKFYKNHDLNRLTPYSYSEGITLCNLTLGGDYANLYSDTNTKEPIIRIAKGDYSLWGANERWQCYWSEEHSEGNSNNSSISGINSYSNNPSKSTNMLAEYYALVKVADKDYAGNEKLKLYTYNDGGIKKQIHKPIGILQVYGEMDLLKFGLMTGSYKNNVSGGVLRRSLSSFNQETKEDGTFDSSVKGIVHNINALRLYGYDYSNGTYENRDDCTFQQTGFVTDGTGKEEQGKPANQGNCSSWGNPMSEIYLESLRYLAGLKTPTTAYIYDTTATTKDSTLGLTAIKNWDDPLSSENYCAPLSILNFNASVSGYDGNQIDTDDTNGWKKICPDKTAKQLTDDIGTDESITSSGKNWFIGSNGGTGEDNNQLCTGKSAVTKGFGAFSGLCPEAPTQEGTYLMAGLAHYAHTKPIRSDLPRPESRKNSNDYMVNTYGIAMATNVPKIDIKVGSNTVTLLPAYRLDRSPNYGGGTLVDFKIIKQEATEGKFYVNWEDSEMGGDYDQDMWGIISYKVIGNTITITTDAIAESTGSPQGFGYIISGTNHDGVHFHSGIEGFNYKDLTGVLGCSSCQVGNSATSVDYTVTGTSVGVLKDPLLYAAKWGGFIDSNGDNKPLITSEWDKLNNSTGTSVADGLPDNFFYASNPLQLENALNRVFLDIIKRASSGTAAAVVSNNVSGVGALYQAFYEPERQDASNKTVSWIGTVQALWLDSFGYLREDDGDAQLEGYNTDPVIQLFYDESTNKTQVRRYSSTKDDEYAPQYMQGKITAYDASGNVTFTVEETSGTNGQTLNNWTVYNITTGDTGTSTTPTTMTTVTGPTILRTVTVTPASSWLKVGDTMMIACFEFTTDTLENVKPLWSARKQLSQISSPETQRAYEAKADTGRYIKTWIDADADGAVDAGEFTNFDTAMWVDKDANGTKTADEDGIDQLYGYFDVATTDEAKNIINYIRGKEISGFRNRTIDYDGNNTDEVIRLGDVVNSTPTIVGSPQEGFDLLYKDESYAAFKKQYAHRRQVLYVGGNDGLLHAFNGGFYDSSTRAFSVNGAKHDGTAAIAHPLGSEIWAYAPMNLLPHLKWLTKNDYKHTYYVDGKPKVFDAKIFDNDADHPQGWGTVLVVGMRLGGGPIPVDTDNNSSTTERTFRSAYIIMDITNPEAGMDIDTTSPKADPKLLAEIQVPDGSFSTSYPAVFTVKDKDSALDANKWFLVFGSGPNVLTSVSSTDTAKMFLFDLGEIKTPNSSANTSFPSNCTRGKVGDNGSMYILTCISNATNSLAGDPITVDWNLDYKADSIYMGTAGDYNATSGRLMRLDINNESSPDKWSALSTVINVSQPVLAAPTPAQDTAKQKWIFFGTGRFFTSNDQSSKTTQSIYGVKDSGSEIVKDTTTGKFPLLDVTDASVETDGTLSGVSGATTFKALNAAMGETGNKGWYLNLPPISGTAGTSPATRVINSSALSGGVLFTTAYQPSPDKCTGDGLSRLYGLYYRTGTAYPDPAVLGTKIVLNKKIASPYLELGHGFATTPSLHSGEGSGDKNVTVFTQLSTGTIIRTEAKTVHSIRSRMESWKED
jgi:type IV pilus assembly protein PilY1